MIKEYLNLDIRKEDFEDIVKYVLTGDQEQFERDLDKKGFIYSNCYFDYFKDKILYIYKQVDYCLLDDIKYYYKVLNKVIKDAVKDVNRTYTINGLDDYKDTNRILVETLYSMDMNEENCLEQEWFKLWNK